MDKLKITKKGERGEDGHKIFSIRINDALADSLNEISIKTGRSRNEVIGILLEYAINNCEVEQGE